MPQPSRIIFLQIAETLSALSMQFRMLADSITSSSILDTDFRQKRLNEISHVPIEELELSVRSVRVLKTNNIKTVANLAELTRKDLKNFHSLGAKSIAEIVEVMHNMGLTLEKRS